MTFGSGVALDLDLLIASIDSGITRASLMLESLEDRESSLSLAIAASAGVRSA